ncbi:hypothetical protein Vretifemale_1428, partial [Volvox reticuliferus]
EIGHPHTRDLMAAPPLRGLGNWELEAHVLACEALIDAGKRLQLVLGGVAVLWVQVHLQDLGPIQPVSNPLANNFRWVHEVIQNGVVHRSQGAAAWAGVCLAIAGGRKDPPVGDDDHVPAAELFLKLPDQALLDLMESLKQAVGNVNNDRLPGTVGDIDLFGGSDIQVTQVAL